MKNGKIKLANVAKIRWQLRDKNFRNRPNQGS